MGAMKKQTVRYHLTGYRVACVFCVSAAWLSFASSAFADGIIRDSVEAISGGRGGTNIANSDNGAVILSNPAGILNNDGCGFVEVGADTLIMDLRYSNPLNDDVEAHNRPLVLPTFAYFQKSEDGNWAAGLGVFAPAGFAAGWDLKNPVFGTQPYQSFGSLVKILPALSYRLADGLSIGATLGVSASYEELHTPFFLQTGPAAGAPFLMTLRGLGFSPTWSTGLQYDLTETTTIGLVYTSEDRINADGHVSINVLGLPPNPQLPTFSRFNSRLNIVWPQTVGAGIKQDLPNRQRVTCDVVWLDWSHAFKSFDLELINSSNPVIPAVLGPVIRDTIGMNWKDSVSVPVGYEWFYSDANVLRAGYIYNSNQTPSASLTPLIPAILEHAFTIGHGTNINNWRFDVAYQYSFGPQRNVDTSSLVGGDFSNSTFSAQAQWISVSLSHQF
jgi:long-chain fatty acid transport protein